METRLNCSSPLLGQLQQTNTPSALPIAFPQVGGFGLLAGGPTIVWFKALERWYGSALTFQTIAKKVLTQQVRNPQFLAQSPPTRAGRLRDSHHSRAIHLSTGRVALARGPQGSLCRFRPLHRERVRAGDEDVVAALARGSNRQLRLRAAALSCALDVNLQCSLARLHQLYWT